MALKLLALSFLLGLASPMAAQDQEEPDPKLQGMPSETVPETCQRPQWDPRLQLAPDQERYKKNEEVMLSCPEGFQPSFTHVKCGREVSAINHGKPVYREVWLGRDSRGIWARIRSSVECIEVFQVVPGTLEISSTSIKLNWTCRLPVTCQHMRATCRLAVPSSPPCEAEEVKGEEMLHGGEGTFTCPPLQPFTDYSITVSLPPSTILFTWLVRTKETVPDKPEKLMLDPSTGSLKWEPLPSCKGEITGYQGPRLLLVPHWNPSTSGAGAGKGRLPGCSAVSRCAVGRSPEGWWELLPCSSVLCPQLNITRRAEDRALLEMERLQLSSSVTEHRLPEHSPSSSYVVTLQGLTAAGAGAASLWELQASRPGTPHPLNISCRSVRDVSPSQGTVVLPLHPIAQPPEAAREHQLIVVATHDGTALDGACWGEPQPFNASQQPGTYVAAVLNLTTSTDFVLGDGTRGRGYHNAALRTGWDYTALLRLVRRSQQAEKFTCVCYSFSVVAEKHPAPWRGAVIGVVVLLVLLLLSSGILLFIISRRRKSVQKS
ncbi:uncharacterized protein LJ264_015282 [Porphyrio hochstetteri]